MKQHHAVGFGLIVTLILASCSSQPQEEYAPVTSYLTNKAMQTKVENADVVEPHEMSKKNERIREDVKYIPPFQVQAQRARVTNDVVEQFSTKRTLTLSVDDLLLSDYLHEVLGKLLNVSYILSDELKGDPQSVTLNLQGAVTEQKLFLLTQELLEQRGYTLRFSDKIFYIHKKDNSNGSAEVVYGYGSQLSDIPQTSGEIVQMVPFVYGMQVSMGNTLRQMIGVKAVPDGQRNSINVYGKRQDVVRALELLDIFDRPSLANRQIGVYQSTFVGGKDLLDKLVELLKQEGISLSIGSNSSSAISVVNLEKQGRLIFFAAKQDLIERAVFWAKEIDRPLNAVEKQYFIYQPNYSRAVDMGESLEALIGDVSSLQNRTTVAGENQASSTRSTVSASNSEIKMVVDERSNSVIFFSTGEKYQQLLPLVKRLDILPKQVMLEVVIAEVSLKDAFKQGVEFAFNNGNYGISTTGAFMGEGFGGLSYLLQGDRGKLVINMLQTNSLVNILSRPSLVVRDGVNATISVGTDIPITGETTSDPINGDRQTTKIDYRKTGVELSVTPTVNAQGVVIMEIKQKISNETEGTTVGGNPSVFERTINTEVVAESGQTIILGGLISENRSRNDSKVPILGDIPIIGRLFRADNDTTDKTELVVLVTPRVINNSSEWQEIKKLFETNFNELSLSEQD